MLYRLLLALPLCLAAQAFAQQTRPSVPYDGSKYDGYQPIVEDPEPNWDTAVYACPLSIKTSKGEFRFSEYRLSDAGMPQAELRAEPMKYIQYHFNGKDDFDLTCEYEGFNTRLVMPRLKGLTACGRNDKPSPYMACWTTDPHAGKK